MSKIKPSEVNIVTEHKEKYKQINLFLTDSYNGLNPSSLSKLAHVIFNLIMYNKMHWKPNHKYYSLEEDRRIYSNILISPEDVLRRISPAKYSVKNKKVANDVSNLTSRIQDLEDDNIFYVWRYKQPFTYLFIMERDVGCWKYYNSEAFVTPKTLKKVVRAGKCIISTMVKLEGKRQRSINKPDIENSFGNFLNRLIDKMNPSVIPELSRWVEKANIYQYLSRLSADLRPIDDYEGQVIAPDFLDHLPVPVRNEINKKTKTKTKTKGKGDNMNMSSLEMDLVPKDENITKARKTRKSKPKDALSPKAVPFKITDPFKNSLSLVKYYRSVVKSQNPEAKFYTLASEVSDAQVVLDTLIKSKRDGDLKFLKMWIYNHVAVGLKGNNIYKPEKTTMKEFLETFSSFNGSYYG